MIKPNLSNHQRHSLRLKDYDYSQEGAYFITICTHNHKCLFGKIVDSVTRLNRFGNIVNECCSEIPHHFPNVEIDAFVIMPNHIHGILVIHDCRGNVTHSIAGVSNVRRGDPLGRPYTRPHGPAPDSVGTITGQFKSVVTKRINKLRHNTGTRLWQRNYYEHVIRNEHDLNDIRQYILDNPVKWDIDGENPTRHLPEPIYDNIVGARCTVPLRQGEPICPIK